MRAPRYKMNAFLASLLGSQGLPAHALDPFHTVPGEGRRLPDLVLIHSLAGPVLVETEVGRSALDPAARSRLEQRARERFNDKLFHGFDLALLLVYPRRLVEKLGALRGPEVARALMGESVGLGLAARGSAFGLESHYIRWYDGEARIVSLPQALNMMVAELFRDLRRSRYLVWGDVSGFVQSILSVMEDAARSLAVAPSGCDSRFWEVALGLGIVGDHLGDCSSRIENIVKFILLLRILIIIFYEIVRLERSHDLESLDCDSLNASKLADRYENLVRGKHSNTPMYEELDHDFTGILRGIPENRKLESALQQLCREVKRSLPLVRRMGWDVLSMLYQRLLSEAYRRAFATFYTKLPAARLLASLAIDRLEDRVVDPASGTGSLLLASLERRRALLGGETLRRLLRRAIEQGRPLLEVAHEEILANTAGMDALKPSLFIAALSLRIATHGSPPTRLNIYHAPVGAERAGSLDLLTERKRLLPERLRLLAERGFDVVIMNPPFTRSDRVSHLIGEEARAALSRGRYTFGGVRVGDLLTAGLAKPFMVLADRLVVEGGRIAAVLPSSVLSRPSWRDVREGLLAGYNIRYIVVSWAPGTPSFSSDTLLREVLLVAEKKPQHQEHGHKPMRIVNLYKPVDHLAGGEVEKIARKAALAERGIEYVTSGQSVIASIVTINLEEELRKRGRGIVRDGEEGQGPGKALRAALRRFAGNLYRLAAFRSPELLRMHLDIVLECSVPLGSIFQVGSVIDHTGGIIVVKRGAEAGLLHPAPALWGSGRRLNVKAPWLDVAPHNIGVASEDGVRIRYWRESGQTFYRARLFLPRRVQLDTQYVLMVRVGEESVSNVWWPLRPLREGLTTRYLVYMNSVFGLINLLGERLETRGLYIELKKRHLREMPIPDLSPATPPSPGIEDLLRREMSRLDKYVQYMSKAQSTSNKGLEDLLDEIVEKAGRDKELKPIARRAMLDREALRMLRQACPEVHIPQNLYVLLASELQTLQKIMEHTSKEEIIRDTPEKPEKERKHRPLTNWM